MLNELKKGIFDLQRKLALSLAWGEIHKVDTNLKAQASFANDETKEQTNLNQQYGFASRPASGTKCIAICNGNRRNLEIIASDNQDAPKLNDSESCIYANASKVHLKDNGSIEISNGQEELVALICSLVDELANSVTTTMVGPQPLSSKAKLVEISQKLKTFKGL